MRLFVAAEPPGAVRDLLAATAASLAGSIPGLRPVPAQNLHLTLVFAAAFPDDDVPALCDGIGAALRGLAAPTTRVRGLGAFPSPRRARVVWAGLDDARGAIGAVAAAVREAAAGHGIAVETRPYTPHLTVGWLREPAPAVPAIDEIRVESAPFRIEELTVFRSRLGRPAPVYEALERLRIGG